MRKVFAIVIVALLALTFAVSAQADQGVNEPGSGCNGEAAPGPDCRPDPQPDHGQDCEAHGQNHDGNEDHCLGTDDDGSTDGTTDDGTTDGSSDDGTVDPTPTPTPEVAPPVIRKHAPRLAHTGVSAVSYLWLSALGLSLVGGGLLMRRRAA